MSLGPTQKKTGFEQEDSPPVGGKTGREDGSEGAQKKTGYEREDSGPIGGRTGRDSGFGPTQPGTGVTSEDSGPSKGAPSGTPRRVDEVKDL